MRLRLPISPKYDSPIFNAVAIQIVVGIVGLLMIDPVGIAQIFGIALVAFWGGAAVLIWRHRESPSRLDLELIRFGYFPVIVLTVFLVGWVWHLRRIL